MKKVMIIKCSGDNYWYKDRIGETFKVEVPPRLSSLLSKIILPSQRWHVVNTVNTIDKKDCVILT